MKLYYQIKDFILDLHTKRSMFIIMIIALQLSLSNEAFKNFIKSLLVDLKLNSQKLVLINYFSFPTITTLSPWCLIISSSNSFSPM